MRVKVIGAGSIGCHLANASRFLGWEVDLCDIDGNALNRTRNLTYPSRYGKWDESINLFLNKDVPKSGYDLILIGTPPDSHMSLAIQAIKEGVRAVLVEKPFCTPDLAGAQELYNLSKSSGVPVFVGYDHVVGKASSKFVQCLTSSDIGDIHTLDVEFRECWSGIFSAHPWLDGPQDSYLGFWRRGGGASGEHSHAVNLWQYFSHELGGGRVVEVQAMMDFVKDGNVDYDKLCLMNLRTENGLVGRVVQDVVTNPPRKWARAQGRNGYVEWMCAFRPSVDAVIEGTMTGSTQKLHEFPKTRPDDFIQELQHIITALDGDDKNSPLDISRGLDTMLVVAAAFKSVREKRTITIDYSRGYTDASLK
jgi:predicted dehydrogenase